MLLFINDCNYGFITEYHQDRTKKQWVFRMNYGIFIHIDFDNIKIFNSSTNIDITLKTF